MSKVTTKDAQIADIMLTQVSTLAKDNLLEILTLTLRNFIKLPVLRYLGICNVLCIWSVRAFPTYRVYPDSMINYYNTVETGC